MRVQTYLLGIDLGTGSSKGVLATPDGRVVATATRPHGMSMPRPGWAEVDAEAVWWTDVVALCRELVPAAVDGQVAGLCVSGVGPCLVLCDAADVPVRPAILYGIDMRATAEIAELTERYGAERILERGGTPLSTQAVGPKALWVQRHEPRVWARAARWYNSSSYVVARLTGEYVLDHHTASQCDPLYDIRAGTWCDDWAEDVMAGMAMPRLAWPAEVVGTVHAAAAGATGLPEGTPSARARSTRGHAGRRHGDLRQPHELAAGADRRRAVPRPGGRGRCGAAGLGRAAAAVLRGRAHPVFDPRARGVVAGLSLRHRRGHLFRAAYEGIAFGIRQILELLEEDGGTLERIVAVGGGTQGGLWTQIVSDVTGREQLLPAQTIGAAYGDALLAALGAGLVAPGTDWAQITRHVVPDPSTREVYDQLYDAYRSLYPATREHVHLLAALQERAGTGIPT